MTDQTPQPADARTTVTRAMTLMRAAQLVQPQNSGQNSAAYCLLTAFVLACSALHIDHAEFASDAWHDIAADLGRYSLHTATQGEAGHA
ncbi:hypothetical protein [Pannonibacter sp. SL95]|uniref:hypothetical protein n=1 Tax=Pannonibacter sp. SL95 TaxID=2995153 RepID=UPI0022735EA9|nr:hypothetical protein [Pannonibacter sp. SL95]MCY1704517.1 hypothetical protein [Pannonibacter sp. SL95]MCY1707296.1 hypothetical protein [Pannonibacter sp. SL95]MCY1709021.1 hypothetical protein [Pannonibacter sp. SL95]